MDPRPTHEIKLVRHVKRIDSPGIALGTYH
jgi:hypothetical protein